MKIALCTELRNVEWFESRLRSLFDGDGQLVIDELCVGKSQNHSGTWKAERVLFPEKAG